MTAPELIDSLERAGATLVTEDGKTRVRGAKVRDELLAALKEQRAEVIAEWRRRQAEDRDRYGRVPAADAPMLAHEIKLPEESKQQVMAHVFRQPRPVHAWVMQRSNRYFEQGVPVDECEWCACVDVIAWQRASSGPEAVEFVLNLRSL